jgi:hypothetical protein
MNATSEDTTAMPEATKEGANLLLKICVKAAYSHGLPLTMAIVITDGKGLSVASTLSAEPLGCLLACALGSLPQQDTEVMQ